MAKSVKCLACKHEDITPSQASMYKLGMWTNICNHSGGGGGVAESEQRQPDLIRRQPR